MKILSVFILSLCSLSVFGQYIDYKPAGDNTVLIPVCDAYDTLSSLDACKQASHSYENVIRNYMDNNGIDGEVFVSGLVKDRSPVCLMVINLVASSLRLEKSHHETKDVLFNGKRQKNLQKQIDKDAQRDGYIFSVSRPSSGSVTNCYEDDAPVIRGHEVQSLYFQN